MIIVLDIRAASVVARDVLLNLQFLTGGRVPARPPSNQAAKAKTSDE